MKAGGGAQTDFAARVDDAMPGHLFRANAQCPANRARRARRAERARDLSVRRDLAARDAADARVDAGEERIGRGHARRNADINFRFGVHPRFESLAIYAD